MSDKHAQNGRLAAQIDDAKACIGDLARAGCAVQSIAIGEDRHALITVDRPPRGVVGFVRTIHGMANNRVTTHRAMHRDCFLEWRTAE